MPIIWESVSCRVKLSSLEHEIAIKENNHAMVHLISSLQFAIMHCCIHTIKTADLSGSYQVPSKNNFWVAEDDGNSIVTIASRIEAKQNDVSSCGCL
jgi:hypothetical protein